MDNEKVDRIVRMIEKECCRNSLMELCEHYDITCDEFYEFIGAGVDALKGMNDND